MSASSPVWILQKINLQCIRAAERFHMVHIFLTYLGKVLDTSVLQAGVGKQLQFVNRHMPFPHTAKGRRHFVLFCSNSFSYMLLSIMSVMDEV